MLWRLTRKKHRFDVPHLAKQELVIVWQKHQARIECQPLLKGYLHL